MSRCSRGEKGRGGMMMIRRERERVKETGMERELE